MEKEETKTKEAREKFLEENTQEPSPLMKYFAYAHLPPRLQEISEPFCNLAAEVDGRLGDCTEGQMALRKLLEAKDCAVRAALS